MTGNLSTAATTLERRYMLDFPGQAAQLIETLPLDDAAKALAFHPVDVLVPVWRRFMTHVAVQLLLRMPEKLARELLRELLPNEAVRILAALPTETQQQYLTNVGERTAKELSALLAYPDKTAGRIMSPVGPTFRMTMTTTEAIEQLRKDTTRAARSIFLVDGDNRLVAKAAIQDIAIAAPNTRLETLAKPITAHVTPLSVQEEITDLLERDQFADLPVVDLQGVLVGVIHHAALVDAIQSTATVEMQTMVGASKDERALSPPMFAVRKRLPWLQINLLTAFMAAAVVGIFENTIAQFTALAVLLPVVAGQSGNAGAQALAVTMRGLALREISPRQWFSVTFKEVHVGFLNGLAVAFTCAIGVYVWSGSVGLVIVIAMSMVLAMVAAGLAGALVPIVLTKLGQDPAQSSSIVLTTVTDVAGFFSFLGIATLLSAML